MVDIEKVLLILLAHFVADFICQTDKQAINKSKSNWWLTVHVACYGLVLKMFSWLIFDDVKDLVWWVGINIPLHWITDYFTSRLNSYLWRKEMRHWFFVGIGADQLIHYTCLLFSYKWLLNN